MELMSDETTVTWENDKIKVQRVICESYDVNEYLLNIERLRQQAEVLASQTSEVQQTIQKFGALEEDAEVKAAELKEKVKKEVEEAIKRENESANS